MSQVDDVLDRVKRCILDYLNMSLNRHFTLEQIYASLSFMSPLKASREDEL